MSQNFTKRIRGISPLVALACGLAFATANTSALAADHFFTPEQIEFLSTNTLYLQSGDINFIAQPTSPSCSNVNVPARSLDTIKMWASLGQASLLSGKTLHIFYIVCRVGTNTERHLSDVILVK